MTNTHNRLPPAPLKLRPYGALQICLLLLLLLLFIKTKTQTIKSTIKQHYYY